MGMGEWCIQVLYRWNRLGGPHRVRGWQVRAAQDHTIIVLIPFDLVLGGEGEKKMGIHQIRSLRYLLNLNIFYCGTMVW
jgi:hypothetical protein